MNQEARNRLRELANKSHYNGLMHIPHNTILELIDENERMREALEYVKEKTGLHLTGFGNFTSLQLAARLGLIEIKVIQALRGGEEGSGLPKRRFSELEEAREKTETGMDPKSKLYGGSWWTIEPNVGRVVNGLPNRVDRIKCLGNAVVPIQVKKAFKKLMGLK